MYTNPAKAIATTLISLAISAVAAPALAESGKRVDFSDLDVSSPAQVAVMYERINEAAELVCRQASSPWDGSRIRHFKECVQGAVDQAVKDVNLGSLTDLHEGNNEAKLAGR